MKASPFSQRPSGLPRPSTNSNAARPADYFSILRSVCSVRPSFPRIARACERSWQTYPSLHSAFTTPNNPVKVVANQHECGASCSIWISPSITQAVLRPSANPVMSALISFVPAYSPVIPAKPALKIVRVVKGQVFGKNSTFHESWLSLMSVQLSRALRSVSLLTLAETSSL